MLILPNCGKQSQDVYACYIRFLTRVYAFLRNLGLFCSSGRSKVKLSPGSTSATASVKLSWAPPDRVHVSRIEVEHSSVSAKPLSQVLLVHSSSIYYTALHSISIGLSVSIKKINLLNQNHNIGLNKSNFLNIEISICFNDLYLFDDLNFNVCFTSLVSLSFINFSLILVFASCKLHYVSSWRSLYFHLLLHFACC